MCVCIFLFMSNERVGSIVDGQKVGRLDFDLGVTQQQFVNRSFGR